MRTMLSIRVPVEAGNAGIQSGELAQVMQSTLASLHAEAAYFTTMGDGDRGGYVFSTWKTHRRSPPLQSRYFKSSTRRSGSSRSCLLRICSGGLVG
jgi:hypothetical protein